jgi:hypothetical protein
MSWDAIKGGALRILIAPLKVSLEEEPKVEDAWGSPLALSRFERTIWALIEYINFTNSEQYLSEVRLTFSPNVLA